MPTPARTRTPQRVDVAGVSISNPDRVMYPDSGITKLELARYYECVADWMLPQIVERPLALLFCPDGIGGDCAYVKHGKGPSALRRVSIAEKTKTGEYMVVESVEGLVSLMQMNWIEAHTWNSRIASLERPDRLVFDLDPGPEVDWPDVVRAARVTRDALAAHGLDTWVKTSGGRGLHVLAPVQPRATWDDCLAFCQRVAAGMVQAAPAQFTTQFAKAGRERHILVDVLRNRRGNTVITAFSPRARPGAPVSLPLAWDELSPRRRPGHFTVRTVPRRLARLANDPWAGYWTCNQSLPDP